MNQYINNFCQINYFPENRQVYMKWLLPPDEETLLHCYRQGLEMANLNKANNLVTDNSIGFYVDMSMQRALANLISNQLHETSLRRFARVVPSDVLQELVMHKVVGQINELSATQIEFELFNDLNDAMAWCAQLPAMSAN